MANTKLTKREKFNMVLEMVADNEMLKEFIEHELELLDKKANGSDKAKAKKNAENEKLKADLLVALREYGKPVTVSDFHDKSPSAVATLSTSKLTHLLTSLKEDGKVVRTEVKKRPYYSVAPESAEQGQGGGKPYPHFQKGCDAMTKEQQILDFMAKLKISREEAEQLFEDDAEDFIGEEGEQMTEKAKEIKRYEKADKPKKDRKPKERKVDQAKAFILGELHKALEPLVKITNVKTETEISFVYNDEKYTLKLTKHRKEKQSIDRLHKVATCFLLHLPIDKRAEMWYNWRPDNGCAWAESHLSIYNINKFFPNFCAIFCLTFSRKSLIMNT